VSQQELEHWLAFQFFDRDNSGGIDESELSLALSHLLKNETPTDDQVHALFMAADKNSDGKIEFSEFEALYAPLWQRRSSGAAIESWLEEEKAREASRTKVARAAAAAQAELAAALRKHENEFRDAFVERELARTDAWLNSPNGRQVLRERALALASNARTKPTPATAELEAAHEVTARKQLLNEARCESLKMASLAFWSAHLSPKNLNPSM
jgi:hypothetical protein